MSTREIPLSEALVEVSSGVGPSWSNYRVLGATRAGLALAKEPVGKSPERYKLVEPGTIFYNPMRIMIGSIAMVDDGEEPGITSPDYVVFRPRPGVLHHRWFYYWLRSKYGEDMIRSLARGAVRERLLFQRLIRARIVLPPWDIQVLVAQKLESMASLHLAVDAQIDATRELQEVYLRETFCGSQAQSMEWIPIGRFASVQSGYAFKSEWFAGDGIRLLRNVNVLQRAIDWADLVRLPDYRRSEFADYELHAGDLILSLDRPVVNGGLKLARLTSSDVPALLLQRVGRFKIHGPLHPTYLFWFLNSPVFISAVTGHDQSLGVPHISPGQVEAVKLPVPPVEIQQLIASRIERCLRGVGHIGKLATEQRTAIVALTSAYVRTSLNHHAQATQ